jgi:ABC-type multidrug transport system fused ATPase/permease subunit
MAWARGQYRALVLFLDVIGMSIVLLLGGDLVLAHEMDIASYTTFILYSVTIKNKMKEIIDLFATLLLCRRWLVPL